MNKLSLFVLVTSVSIALSLESCNKENITPKETKLVFTDSKKAADLIEADTKFSFDLFKEVLKSDTSENIMISPLSVAVALGMTYNGAEGETKTSFENTLRMSGLTREEVNEIHRTLVEYLLQADSKVTLEIANSIWYRHGFEVLKSFIEVNKLYYRAAVNSLNFSDPSAVKTINDWIAEITHDKIKDVIDKIDDDVMMYLINAIYFKGIWTSAFNPDDTYTSTFTKEDQTTKEVSYMKMDGDINYFSNDFFKATELPYGDEKFSMIFIVPQDGKSISELSDSLKPENFSSWMGDFQKKGFRLSIPKFKFGCKLDPFNAPLINMGLGIAFTMNANFRGISITDPLYISRVIHQSFIEVNEKGSEAAAVTVIEMRTYSTAPYEPPEFKIDRPFIFIIREKESNVILFMGKVGNPGY